MAKQNKAMAYIVDIGKCWQRWNDVKSDHDIENHEDVAALLLDWFEKTWSNNVILLQESVFLDTTHANQVSLNDSEIEANIEPAVIQLNQEYTSSSVIDDHILEKPQLPDSPEAENVMQTKIAVLDNHELDFVENLKDDVEGSKVDSKVDVYKAVCERPKRTCKQSRNIKSWRKKKKDSKNIEATLADGVKDVKRESVDAGFDSQTIDYAENVEEYTQMIKTQKRVKAKREVLKQVKRKKLSNAEKDCIERLSVKVDDELKDELELQSDEGYTIAYTHEKDTPGHLYFGPEKRFRCEKCHLMLKMCGALNQHYVKHLTKEEILQMKMYRCTYCNILYPSFLKRLHENCAASTCPYGCGKVLISRLAYNNHIVNHDPVLGMCDICGKEMRKRELKRHKTISHGKEKIPCRHCNKVFTRRYSLSVHMRKHTGDKPYMCSLCGQSFIQKASWNWHMQSKHPEEV